MGPDVGCHVSGLGRSFVPPPFFPNELLVGTSPEELEGDATSPPPNTGTHLRTLQHLYTIPSLRWTGPPYSPAPYQGGSSSLISIA